MFFNAIIIMAQISPIETTQNVKSIIYKEFNINKEDSGMIVKGDLTGWITIYRFDKQHRVMQVEKLESDNSHYSTTFYSYDTLNNILKNESKNKYGEHACIEYIYNKKSKLVKEVRYGNGFLISYIIIHYENDLISKKENYNSSDILISTYKYYYDLNGNKIKTTWITDGNEKFEEFEYDSLNRKLSYTLFSDSKYTYIYYDNSLVKVESYFENNRIEWIKQFTYDPNGREIKIEYENKINGSIRKDEYQYKYDAFGNVIEIIYFENDNAKYSKVYELQYN